MKFEIVENEIESGKCLGKTLQDATNKPCMYMTYEGNCTASNRKRLGCSQKEKNILQKHNDYVKSISLTQLEEK